jgi:hypothetical protein
MRRKGGNLLVAVLCEDDAEAVDVAQLREDLRLVLLLVLVERRDDLDARPELRAHLLDLSGAELELEDILGHLALDHNL